MKDQIIDVHFNSRLLMRKVGLDLSKCYSRIYEILVAHGRMTGHEIANTMGVELRTISGRLAEMKAKGLIVEDGFVFVNGHKRKMVRITGRVLA